jgi:hypothetical protein
VRYYVLTTSTGDEVVRLSGGTAAYFDTATGRWVSDPLLAVEVRSSGDWRQVEPRDLPPGIADDDAEAPSNRKARRLRRGRHARK